MRQNLKSKYYNKLGSQEKIQLFKQLLYETRPTILIVVKANEFPLLTVWIIYSETYNVNYPNRYNSLFSGRPPFQWPLFHSSNLNWLFFMCLLGIPCTSLLFWIQCSSYPISSHFTDNPQFSWNTSLCKFQRYDE